MSANTLQKWVPLILAVLAAAVAAGAATANLSAHETAPGHKDSINRIQDNVERIKGVETIVEGLKESVNDLRTEQRQNFERLYDKIDSIRER